LVSDVKNLIQIIKNNVVLGSEIVYDEWKVYKSLTKEGFKHYTVNHSENFVNPKTGRHSQLIECLWGIAKNKIMRSMRGTYKKNMQGHLSEQWFRSINPKDNVIVFENILKLYKFHYLEKLNKI
jgi:hypothetical protein